jgi:hypothetical protein
LEDAKETDRKLDEIIADCGAMPYVGDDLLNYKRK